MLIIIIRHFFSFYNIFFYTRQPFVSHFLLNFYIVHNHIVAFLFFFFSKTLISFTSFFLKSFFIILIIFSWWIFRYFYICKTYFIKNFLEGIKILQLDFIVISIIHKILLLLKITIILKSFWRSIIINFYFLKNN